MTCYKNELCFSKKEQKYTYSKILRQWKKCSVYHSLTIFILLLSFSFGTRESFTFSSLGSHNKILFCSNFSCSGQTFVDVGWIWLIWLSERALLSAMSLFLTAEWWFLKATTTMGLFTSAASSDAVFLMGSLNGAGNFSMGWVLTFIITLTLTSPK